MKGLISLEEFCERYPEQADYACRESESPRNILTGFVRWNDACAGNWGGPWAGNHVLATIQDCSTDKSLWRYQDALEKYPYPTPNGPVVDMPTVERPIRLHLAGNDDCSYSAFFDNKKLGFTELESILRQNGVTDAFVCGLALDLCVGEGRSLKDRNQY